MDLNITLLLILASFFVSTFSMILSRTKNHRVKEYLDQSGNRFFYSKIFFRLINEEINQLKLSVQFVRTLCRYAAIIWCYSLLIESPIWQVHFIAAPFDQIVLFFSLLVSGFFVTDTIPRYFALESEELLFKLGAIPTSLICTFFLLILWPTMKLLNLHEEDDEEDAQQSSSEVKEKVMEILHDMEIEDVESKKLLYGIIKYQDRVAREIMIPRVEVFSLISHTSVNEAVKSLIDAGFTRVPVFSETIDQVTGVLMAKDLLKVYLEAQASDKDLEEMTIESLLKPIIYTPENKRISALLQDFRTKQQHIAVVVDEYGGTQGIITIEDILEELVGDIEDEYDSHHKPYNEMPDGSFIVDARMSIFDIQDKMGVKIPTHPDYDSLSGYIFSKVGSIPEVGLVIHQDEFQLEVVSSSERCVEKVRIQLHKKESG